MRKLSQFTIVLFMVGTISYAEKSSPESTTWYWQRGIEAARAGQQDSAFTCLTTVLTRGIAEDSLYYLWAEMYLSKGIIDTALVLNLSIKPISGYAIHNLMYEQRYLIYTTLGWKKEAKAVLDSMVQQKPVGRFSRFIPECALYVSGGGHLENNALDRNYPYPGVDGTMETLKNGSALASLRLEWPILATNGQQVNIGSRIRYSSSRLSVAARTAHQNDSADASVGAYLNYELFSNALSINYMISRKRDFIDEVSLVHLTSVRYALLVRDWMGMIEGGYQFDTNDKEHYGYLLLWGERPVGKSNEFTGELLVSGSSAEAYLFGEENKVVFSKGSVLYTDSTYTKTQPKISFKYTAPPVVYYHGIPRSYLNAAEMARWEHRFSTSFSLGCGGGYSTTWYLEKYRWYYISASQPSGNYNGLAFNGNDGKYYGMQGGNSEGVELNPEPVQIIAQRRIDQTLTMNLFIKRSFGRFGDGMVDLNVRRNFSTLMESAPVDIQKWYGELLFSWFFRYAPERG